MCNSLMKDANLLRRVKLTNTQLKKLKSTTKNKVAATLRITKRNF